MRKKLINLTIILLFGLTLVGCASSPTPSVPPTIEPIYVLNHASNSSLSVESEIITNLESWATFLKFKQYDKVWNILHPDSQALWETQSEFMQQKEKDLMYFSITDFIIGDIEILPQWYDDKTNITYSNTAQIQITIVISTAFGYREDSGIIYSVNFNNKWYFFMYPP